MPSWGALDFVVLVPYSMFSFELTNPRNLPSFSRKDRRFLSRNFGYSQNWKFVSIKVEAEMDYLINIIA